MDSTRCNRAAAVAKKANDGQPSSLTFWTTKPNTAKEFATDQSRTTGIVLKKKFPKSVLENNKSPDRFDEGEVQIPGPVTGADVIHVDN